MTARKGRKPEYTGWWPDLDVQASRVWADRSPEHRRAFALLEKPGRLTLSTSLMVPKGKGTVMLEASTPILGRDACRRICRS